jgi:hypothetical protein
VPGQLLYPAEPFYFIQTPKEVWMIWQRDHMVRRIYLADQHSESVQPSWFGESIGHYENGDTLVIDTIGLSTKNSFIDNLPHEGGERVVQQLAEHHAALAGNRREPLHHGRHLHLLGPTLDEGEHLLGHGPVHAGQLEPPVQANG